MLYSPQREGMKRWKDGVVENANKFVIITDIFYIQLHFYIKKLIKKTIKITII